MGKVLEFGQKTSIAQPIAKAILYDSLEELRLAMVETLGYAALVGYDVDHVRECIKQLADIVEIDGSGGMIE